MRKPFVTLIVAAFIAIPGVTSPSGAQDTPEWLNRISLGGDLRLRHDTQWRTEAKPGAAETKYHRNRERFRLRLGLKAEVTAHTNVEVRLASGSGFQNTTNQSFDEHARGKRIFIDRVSAMWTAGDVLAIAGGKQRNPLFTTPLVWDPDVNPEGLSELLTFRPGDRARVFARLGQWVIEEVNVKDTNSDPFLLSYQAGTEVEPVDDLAMVIAASYYDYRNLDVLRGDDDDLADNATFIGYNQSTGQQMVFDADGRLLNKFRSWEVQGSLELKNGFLPITVFGTYLRNVDSDIQRLISLGVPTGGSDPQDLARYEGDDRDSGWLVGAEIGRNKTKGDFKAEYFYQELEDYAFPAVFVDSDFHGGGTNNKGHRIHGQYNLAARVFANGTLFITKRQDERKDGKKDENRIQLDMVFKF